MEKQSLYDWCIENNKETLLDEWVYSDNFKNNLEPKTIYYRSSKDAVWRCPVGHTYPAKIAYRTTRGYGCPYCSNHRLLKGFNDLQTIAPDVCKEWDYQENQLLHDRLIAEGKIRIHPVTPSELLWGSTTKVYWKCSNGHQFFQSPNGRHVKKDGSFAMCNKCAQALRTVAKRKTRARKNNLADLIPQAIEEWISSEHHLTPYEVSCHSKEMVHWRCKKGHCFDRRVTDRVYKKDGILMLHQCSECIKFARTSIAEQVLFYYIKQVFPDSINPYKELGIELDIYIPSRKIAIEYDGSYTHKDRLKKENFKDEFCFSKGITLYRFRPQILPDTKHAVRITVSETNEGTVNGLKEFFSLISVKPPKMSLEKDYDSILALFKDRVAVSVASTYLLSEWDFKNNTVDPEYVNVMDTKNQYYWVCPSCHQSYPSLPYNRYVRKTGCSVCSNKYAVRHNKRRVQNIETGEIFESLSDAERAYGKEGNTSIHNCCKGRYHTAYNYHWRYYDDEANQ